MLRWTSLLNAFLELSVGKVSFFNRWNGVRLLCQVWCSFRALREVERRAVKRSYWRYDAVGDSCPVWVRRERSRAQELIARVGAEQGLQNCPTKPPSFVDQHHLWLWAWVRPAGRGSPKCSSHCGVACLWGFDFPPEVSMGRCWLQAKRPGKATGGKERTRGKGDVAEWWARPRSTPFVNPGSVVCAKALFLSTRHQAVSFQLQLWDWEAKGETQAFSGQYQEEGLDPTLLISNHSRAALFFFLFSQLIFFWKTCFVKLQVNNPVNSVFAGNSLFERNVIF